MYTCFLDASRAFDRVNPRGESHQVVKIIKTQVFLHIYSGLFSIGTVIRPCVLDGVRLYLMFLLLLMV